MVRENSAASVREVALAFLRLGVSSFGGPAAHIGYFRAEFVMRRRWLAEAQFAALTALCQALPGPASSQLGVAIGWQRAGAAGALAAWLAFTLPSALLMLVFALAPGELAAGDAAPVVHGLKLVAAAVLAQAVLGMATSLAPDPPRLLVAAIALTACLLWPGSATQVLVLAAGAAAGLRWAPPTAWPAAPAGYAASAPHQRAVGLALIGVLLALAWLAFATSTSAGRGALAGLAAACFTAGALVFGGGHAVLPLLGTGVVDGGLLSRADFVAGYGAAQVLPGPLFSIGAYVGARVLPDAPLLGGVVGLLALFLPGLLLVAAALPGWSALAASPRLGRALAGVNAAVVGVLAAALYDPVAIGGLRTPEDGILALVALGLLLALGPGVRGTLAVLCCCVGGSLLLAR